METEEPDFRMSAVPGDGMKMSSHSFFPLDSCLGPGNSSFCPVTHSGKVALGFGCCVWPRKGVEMQVAGVGWALTVLLCLFCPDKHLCPNLREHHVCAGHCSGMQAILFAQILSVFAKNTSGIGRKLGNGMCFLLNLCK